MTRQILLTCGTVAALTAALVGQQHQVKPDALPKPFATPDVRNPPTVIAQPEGASLNVPKGFSAKVFAEGGFKRMRWVAVAPSGDVFATDSDLNTLTVLRDTNGDGTADQRHVFAEGLARPFGIAFGAGHIYVANAGSIVRWPYTNGQLKAEGPGSKIVEMPAEPGHWTRNISFSPDGARLYVTLGSSSDAGAPDADRALVFSVKPDGSDRRVLATGLRNPIGLGFEPSTRTLWAAVQERDKLGDDLVPDYITSLRDGGFYGWPFAYVGPNEDPRHAGERPDLVKQTLVPDVLLEAHSAVMGLVFYQGKNFPSSYRGSAFATLRGSSNRSLRTGYKVIHIPFVKGRPSGGYEDFATGWMLGEDKKEVWGRPVGIAVAGDGALLVVDDANQRIWRIAHGA
ncbi:MAG: sorbosone dehydrogenase family protein [Vicinamibacteria bacterium]|nr:sorbosone dehydrogenase family protein [Vicinamibacteria bacterium]